MKSVYLLVFFVIAFGCLRAQDTIIQLKPVEISTSKSEIVRLAPHYSQIDMDEIALQTSSKEIPGIIAQIPGTHSVIGKGIGDTEFKIRGFDISNIQLLINDIPESAIDAGWVYWSNFTGIEDFTQNIFLTKGVSNTHPFSKAGGTISIHLIDASVQKFTRFSSSYSNLVGNKLNFVHSSGELKNGFAWAVGGTYRFGSTYKDETWFKGGNYFFNASKKLGAKNKMQITIIGSPQRHGQIQYYPDSLMNNAGLAYNPNWGYLNGDPKQSSINFYHRTLAQIKLQTEFNKRNNLKTVLNFSCGDGGATASFGNSLPTSSNGLQIDFDAAVAANQANYDSINGGNNARYFLGDYVHKEASTFLFSEFNHSISDSARLSLGIHAYSSLYIKDFGRVNDLLGADFQAYPGEPAVRSEGEKIWYDSKSSFHGAGLSGTWVKTTRWMEYTASGSLTQSSNSNTDLFNIPDSAVERSDMKWFTSYNIKSAVQRRLNKDLRIYFTAGYQHKRPPIKYLGKTVIDNTTPETFISAEIGFRKNFESSFKGELHGDVYLIRYNDQTFTKTYFDPSTMSDFSFSVQGLNSRYIGAELEFKADWYQKFNGLVSLSWTQVTWLNDIESIVADKAGNVLDTIVLNAKGLISGEQPQLSAYVSGMYTFLDHYQISAGMRYCGINYSWFNVLSYAGSADAVQSWRYPDYWLADIGIAYKTKLRNKVGMRISAQVHNLLNQSFISESLDGWNHDQNSAWVIYGYGRCLTAGVALEF